MERVFFPFDAELKTELDQIKLAIQGEQNGIAARSMGEMAYKKNYGVPYISLRKLASQYQPSKKLANCLWNIGYRETMLLSLMLLPKEDVTLEEAVSLVSDMQELELVEFACRDVLCKLSFADALVIECLSQNAPLSLECSYILAARLLENGSSIPGFTETLYGRIDTDLLTNKSSVAKSISNFLKQLGVFSSQSEKVMAFAGKLSASDDMLLRWVAEEVKTFVEYTDHKA